MFKNTGTMKTYLILAALVSVASAESYSANLNDYVDALIPEVQAYIAEHGLDPVAMPNITESFSYKPLLITYSGYLNLVEGVLTGLVHSVRTGDVVLNYEDKKLNLDGSLVASSALATYSFSKRFLLFSSSGTMKLTGRNVVGSANATIDLSTYTMTLDQFEVTKIGKISSVMGGSLVNIIIGSISSLGVKIFRSEVISFLNSYVTEVLTQSIGNINNIVLNI